MPIAVYDGYGEAKTYDTEYMDRLSLAYVALPFAVETSGISLDELISGSLITKAKNIFNAAMLLVSFDNLSVSNARGSFSIAPTMPDYGEGKASITITYDNLSMLYSMGGPSNIGKIDGSTELSAVWDDGSLITIIVDSDNTLAGEGKVELQLYFDYGTYEDYLSFTPYTKEEVRAIVYEMLLSELTPFMLSYILGENVSSMSYEECISLLSSRNMLDILDFIAFAFVASEDVTLNEYDPIAMCIDPVIIVDGKTLDVNLRKLMQDVLSLAELLD